MAVIFLLPGLISFYFVIRGRIETAFLNVFLPCLLLLPEGYALRLPHLPALSAAEWALVPIGAAALSRMVQNGLPSLLDILIVLFMTSMTITEVLKERVINDGFFVLIYSFVSICLPYAVGRTIIEPGIRLMTVRRFVVLILLLGPIGLYEWRFGLNLYGMIGQRIFSLPNVQAGVQIRGGHGRMSGSFNDAELGGLVFAMAAAMNVWLFYLRKWGQGANLGKRLSRLEQFHIPGLLLLLYIMLTQSRGPMLGVGVAYLILQIPRFENKKAAAIVVGVLLAVGAFGGYQYFKRYTDVDPSEVKDEQQGSALYRRQMNELYKPIVKAGGWLGWGRLNQPILPGMFSIDNEFLVIHLAFGTSGYILFVLITAETFRALVFRTGRLKTREDQAFAIALLGATAVFFVSIITAWMGEQTPHVAFLLIGWGQSLKASRATAATVPEYSSPSKFALKRVFQ